MNNKCYKCGMTSGLRSMCPTCEQNELIQEQTQSLKRSSESEPDFVDKFLFYFKIAIAVLAVYFLFFN